MSEWNCQLEDVSARWPRRENTLTNITSPIPIDQYSKLPLMGPSGEGKSTLLYLLAALKWPSKGKITWTFPDGNSYSWDKKGLNSRQATFLHQQCFGFSFQNSTLSRRLTIEENIAYPLVLTGEKWNKATREKVRTQLGKVLIKNEKIDEILKLFPAQLSGGQKQRVALAQAMVHQPWVLFADEPTGQLDYCTRKHVMKVLKDWLTEDEQRRFIWVTHHHTDDMEMMKVDKLLFVKDGTCQLVGQSRLKEWMTTCDEQM